jgi:hypothetical protein
MNRLAAVLTVAVVALLIATPVQAGYFGPCYRLVSTTACPVPLAPEPSIVGFGPPAAPFVTPVPAPVVYSGGSYDFYGRSFTAGSAYGPNYVGPNYNTQRYPNPGPYYYTAGYPFASSYYSYYYTPGYFRY